MSKYRVEFKKSRLLVIYQLLSCAFLVFTVLNWQPEIFKYEFLLQVLIAFITSIYFFKMLLLEGYKTRYPIVFSDRGEWIETNLDGQVSWKITGESRVSSFLIFVHLSSVINYCNSKWCLVYKDQVNEQDYRRLCRAIIYQQQMIKKTDI